MAILWQKPFTLFHLKKGYFQVQNLLFRLKKRHLVNLKQFVEGSNNWIWIPTREKNYIAIDNNAHETHIYICIHIFYPLAFYLFRLEVTRKKLLPFLVLFMRGYKCNNIHSTERKTYMYIKKNTKLLYFIIQKPFS